MPMLTCAETGTLRLRYRGSETVEIRPMEPGYVLVMGDEIDWFEWTPDAEESPDEIATDD